MTVVPNLRSTAEYQAMDAAHHWHPFTDTKALNATGARVFTADKGVWLTDSEGNKVLDGMAGMHRQSGMAIEGIEHIGQPYWFGEGR